MNVPLLDLRAQYKAHQQEFEQALLRIAESQACILGKEVEILETTLAEYCDSKASIGVSSGTDALLMALMEPQFSPGDEILVPTYTFFCTAGCVARLGLVPVFVDCDPVTYNIDIEDARRRCTERTRGIIPVHLFGQAADMDAIMEFAQERNLVVIEDAAQAIGTQYKDGRKVGSIGRTGCFSFYPTKNLGAFGDGGLVTCGTDELAVYLKQMRNHGMEPRYYHKFIGGNFRLDAIQAAVLNVKMQYLENWHEQRRQNAEFYNAMFQEKGLVVQEPSLEERHNFAKGNAIIPPVAIYKDSGVKNYHIYNQYTIKAPRRDELRTFLAQKGIGTEIYYPVPFHKQECFQYLQPDHNGYPHADFCAAHALSLPIYPEAPQEHLAYTVEAIAEFYRQ